MIRYTYSTHLSLYRLCAYFVHRAGKALTKGLKGKALIAGTLGAAALTSVLGGYAKAEGVEGYVDLYYYISGVGEADAGLGFFGGCSNEWDEGKDGAFYPMFGPEQVYDIYATSSHGGREAHNVCYPPLDSSGGETFSVGAVMKPGETNIPIVEDAEQTLSWSISGLDGCDVYVNGVNARTNSSLSLGKYSGPVTGVSESIQISVTKNTTPEPPEPPVDPNNWTPWDPNTPDPNTPVTPADPNAFVPAKNPDPNWHKKDPACLKGLREFPAYGTLFISNLVEGYITTQNPRALAISLIPGESDALDGFDIIQSSRTDYPIDPQIISYANSAGVRGKSYPVITNAKAPDSIDLDFLVKLRFDTSSANSLAEQVPINLDHARDNCISFAYPVASLKGSNTSPTRFYGKKPVFWINGIDSPVWDVNGVITGLNGVFQLPETQTVYYSEANYFDGTLSFSRALGDVVRNTKVDAADYNYVLSKRGFKGTTSADVGGESGIGMPDGVVDSKDLEQLYSLLPAAEKAKVVAPATGAGAGSKPLASAGTSLEGFESGVFEAGWSTSGALGWRIVAQQRHSGTLSAQSGQIGDDQSTSLTLTAQCTGGEIRFWRKISTEPNWDNYTFSINGKQMEKLSGEKDWQQVSFPVTAGSNSFEWSYTKDGSSSQGEDAVWIDDVEVPVGS